MPVRKVKKKNKVIGYRWGKSGKLYTGKNAKEKAKKQGQAIKISQKQNYHFLFEPIEFKEERVKVKPHRRGDTWINSFIRKQDISKEESEENPWEKLDKSKLIKAGLATAGAGLIAGAVLKDRRTLKRIRNFKEKAKNYKFISKQERKSFVREGVIPNWVKKHYNNIPNGSLVKRLNPDGTEHFGVSFTGDDNIKRVAHVAVGKGPPTIIEEPIEKGLAFLKTPLWEVAEDVSTSLSNQQINDRAWGVIGANVKYGNVKDSCETYARLIVENKIKPTTETRELTALSKIVDSLHSTWTIKKNREDLSDAYVNPRQLRTILNTTPKSPDKQKKSAVEKLNAFYQNKLNFSRFLYFEESSNEIKIPEKDIDRIVFEGGKLSPLKSFLNKLDKYILNKTSKFNEDKQLAIAKLIRFTVISNYLTVLTISLNSELGVNFSTTQVESYVRKDGTKVRPYKRKRGWAVYPKDRRTPILVEGNLPKKVAIKKALSIKKRGSDKVDKVRRLTDSEQRLADKGKWVKGHNIDKNRKKLKGRGPTPNVYKPKEK